MIRGERTFLRPASEDDLDLLVGWLADPEVYRWWEGRPLSRDEVADVYTGRRRPEVEPFVVEAEGVPVGYLQVWQGTEMSGGIDIFLVPEARGRGLGPDAARTASRFLLDRRGWTEVTVDPMVDNIRAIRRSSRPDSHRRARSSTTRLGSGSRAWLFAARFKTSGPLGRSSLRGFRTVSPPKEEP